MVDTIGADYFFVFEQVLSACCAKFRKEQTKQIIEIIQEPFHGIKIWGYICRKRSTVCDDLGNGQMI
jgi:hypothetical protein